MEIPDLLSENNIKVNIEVVEGGKKLTVYRDGEPCSLARLENDSARRVAAYQGLLTDIFKLRSFLSLACEIVKEKFGDMLSINILDSSDRDQVICSGLYVSAVSLYGKAFTKADGRNVKLEESALKKLLSDKQVKTHEKLSYLRDNWTAHGGRSDHEFVVPLVAFSNGCALPLFLATSTAFISLSELQDMLELCEPMIEMVEGLKAKHEKKVLNNEDKPALLRELSALRMHAKDHLTITDPVSSEPKPSKKRR